MDQLDRLYPEDPALRLATPLPTSLSAPELQTLVTGRIKLPLHQDLKRGKDVGFTVKGLVGIDAICNLTLLPGGKSLLAIDSRGGVTLRRIELRDGQAALSVVANIKSDQTTSFGVGWRKSLTAMSPCPILVHARGMK